MSKETTKRTREQILFQDTPVWKSLLKMAIPSMIVMLIFGLYTFMDNVLSINYAYDSYTKEAAATGLYTGKDLVRLFMSGVTPITTFIFAVTMLFGVGVSRRYSINLGAGNVERANKTIKTTMQISLAVSILLIPVLIFTAKPWMSSQFDGDPRMAALIEDKGFDYVWIIILSFPLQMFNQIATSVFRAEARNKEMLIAVFIPILINLLFDWVFMGPAGLGVEGGAWATFISYVVTTALMVYYMVSIKETNVKFKNLFGRHGFQWITIVGVILVGIAPFMRNMAQSITQTVEMRQIQDVSQAVYGNNMQMSVIMTAVFPVFGLFFPMMFGFIQAGSPITGFNYGAGDMKKVKESTWLIMLYSTLVGGLIFVLSAYALIGPLNSLLGIEDKNFKLMDYHPVGTDIKTFNMPNAAATHTAIDASSYGATTTWTHNFVMVNGKPLVMSVNVGGKTIDMNIVTHVSNKTFHTLDKAQKMYAIMMCSSIAFGPALGAMSLFGSTDRVFLNILASTLRGVILLIPMLLIFAHAAEGQTHDIAQNNLGTNGAFTQEYFFWWFYPILAVITSLILLACAIYVMKHLDKKHTTLDSRIEKIHEWNKNRRLAKSK